MIHQPEYVKILIKKYVEGSASPVEVVRLRAAWKLYEDDRLLQIIKEVMVEIDEAGLNDPLKNWNPSAAEIIHRGNEEAQEIEESRNKQLVRRAGLYVLMVLVILGAVAIGLFSRPDNRLVACAGITADGEVPTAIYSCTLILDSLHRLTVDSNLTGKAKRMGNLEIKQLVSGVLEYNKLAAESSIDSVATMYHKVLTPAKQQYQLILSDGTRVRLNASTVIRFPALFAADQRVVELEGEAYFEVADIESVPFLVKTKNGSVETSQSRFTVNTSYLRTTVALDSGSLALAHGTEALRVSRHGDVAVLLRSDINSDSGKDTIIYFKDQDIDQLLVWKRAERVYTQVSLRHFVLDMCRWYGLQFENLNCVPDSIINAKLCYLASLEELLGVFREKGLTIHLNGQAISFCDPARKPSPAPQGQIVFAQCFMNNY